MKNKLIFVALIVIIMAVGIILVGCAANPNCDLDGKCKLGIGYGLREMCDQDLFDETCLPDGRLGERCSCK